MGNGSSFLVILGALRETLSHERRVLAFLATAGRKTLEVGEVDDAVEKYGWRVRRLEELAVMVEALLPHEVQVRALAVHTPIAVFSEYRLIGPADILDDRGVLLRGRCTHDMGKVCQIDIAGDGHTRYLQAARGEVVGVMRESSPLLPASPPLQP